MEGRIVAEEYDIVFFVRENLFQNSNYFIDRIKIMRNFAYGRKIFFSCTNKGCNAFQKYLLDRASRSLL